MKELKRALLLSDSNATDILNNIKDSFMYFEDTMYHGEYWEAVRSKNGDDRVYFHLKSHYLIKLKNIEFESLMISSKSAYSITFKEDFFEKKINKNPDIIFLFFGMKDINYNLGKYGNVQDVVKKYIKKVLETFDYKKIYIITPKPPSKFLDQNGYNHEKRMINYKNFLNCLEKECQENNLKIIKFENFVTDAEELATFFNDGSVDPDHIGFKKYSKLVNHLIQLIEVV